ncbi:MAG: hypothetical protein WCG09_00645 [Halobacteriota archaeon]
MPLIEEGGRELGTVIKFSMNLSWRLLSFFAANAFQQCLLMWREVHDLLTSNRTSWFFNVEQLTFQRGFLFSQEAQH